MSDANNITPFSPADILKYQQGLLSPQEMHAMEKAALEDPFLADALEGYAATGVQATDLQDLRNRLAERTSKGKVIQMGSGKSGFPWLRIAAILLMLAGAGIPLYVYIIKPSSRERTVAQNNVQPTTPVVTPAANDTLRTAPAEPVRVESPAVQNGTATKPDAEKTGITSDDVKTDLVTLNKNDNASAAPTVSVPDPQYQHSIADLERKKEYYTDSITAKTKATGYEKDYKASGRADANKLEEVVISKPSANQNNSSYITIAPNTKNISSGSRLKVTNQPNTVYVYNNFRGRITDNNNNPLPFANITNVEDNVGTYSDARGYFNLTSPDSVLNVQVKSVGFNNSTAQLRNTLLNNQVSLQEDKTVSPLVLNTKKLNADLHARNNNQKLTEPEPSDGWDNYDTYLTNNLNVPDDYSGQKSGSNGEVEISFEVDSNGEPVNIRVERSLCSSCDKEAIRLIKDGPKWKRNAKKGRTKVVISF